jgi:uncharacterized protein (DUF58 family)
LKIRRTRLRHVEPLGWAVCATALVLGVAGLNSGNNILYLITGFLLAAVVVSGQVSRRSLRSLRLSIDLPSEVWAQEPSRVRLHVENASRLWPLIHMELFVEWQGPMDRPENAYRQSAGYRLERALLLPGQRRKVHLVGAFPERGRYRLERVRVGSRGPFGWFYRWGWVEPRSTVVVYPRRWPHWEREGAVWFRRPASVVRPQASAEDFYGLRAYQPGDPLHWVHWPSLARTGSLQVRQWALSEDPALWIVLDRRMEPSALERALSWVATGLWSLAARKASVVFWTQGWGPAAIRQRSVLHACLTYLALAQPVSQPLSGPASPDSAGIWVSAQAYPPPSDDWHWIPVERLIPPETSGHGDRRPDP